MLRICESFESEYSNQACSAQVEYDICLIVKVVMIFQLTTIIQSIINYWRLVYSAIIETSASALFALFWVHLNSVSGNSNFSQLGFSSMYLKVGTWCHPFH